MRSYLRTYLLFIAILLTATAYGQSRWVDSLYNAMTLEEKIGQLYMVKAYSKGDKAEEQKVLEQIRKYKVGGLCFFQGSPSKQAELTNKYQNTAKTPLLISIDGEWGLGMRFKDKAMSFPRQLTLGAIQDNNLIYEMGRHVASQLKRIGIHVNFAPVVDVNNNPNNPVINDRSFGEDKYNVAAKGYAYMKGMQDMGVMACMKHFPGHGDTDVDSHMALPVMHHSRSRLDSIELVPFKMLVKQGISSTMVAHLHIPALDNRPNRPTTLSKASVTDILKDELDFNGLIYTDAMEMKGVANYFPDGKADLEAFLAGVDVILLPTDLGKGISEIKKAVQDGRISEERLAHSVKKILRAKHAVGLHNRRPIALSGIQEYVNNNRALSLKEQLIENALTLVKDDQGLVPITNVQQRISSIGIGQKEARSTFQKMLGNYTPIRNYSVGKHISTAKQKELFNKTEKDDLVIVSFHDMSKYASRNFGIDDSSILFVNELAKRKKVIVVLFGSPYALRYFNNVNTILLAYQGNETTESVAAQSLFGSNTIKGKLPVNASRTFPYNQGIYREGLGTLGYSLPERVGMNSDVLKKIDTIAAEMIRLKAAPGGQVLVAKDGKIVWDKTYGYHTYKKNRPVLKSDIYDVASVTKICASTIALMKLYDEQKFDLNASLFRYLPAEVDTCNKRDLNVRAMLAHHARLAGWIPFYKKTISKSRKNPKPLDEYYQSTASDKYSIKVADKLYLRSDYRDSILSRIYASELKDETKYKYSDLAFYLFRRIIEQQTGSKMQDYVSDQFYRPLGLRRTGYLPLNRFDKKEIVPSEEDTYFRKTKIHGHVHDMGAAMMGGVEGHAGLFSTAQEIGVILQMLLNGGSYGGRQYLQPSTVRTFTTRYSGSTRRGLGFDMKELDTEKYSNMSEFASASTFGHLGFTGISAFADPEYNLIFILVTNRTYPTMKNRVFGKKDFRPRMQSVAYKSMMERQVTP